MRLTLAMRLTLVTLLLTAGAWAQEKKKGSHPHFDDQGTLTWYTKLADAQAAAKKEGKLIFIEYGRKL
ncbi:MAG: hypothetical protein ACYTHK_19250 [Planctomycetota bacterium]|jgi:hypothetical protein